MKKCLKMAQFRRKSVVRKIGGFRKKNWNWMKRTTQSFDDM